MKLHVGCGSKVLEGYTNIDKYVDGPNIEKFDILKLPYADYSIDEILAEHLVEHLTFAEEKIFFEEMYRLLKTNGLLHIEVPDFEWVVKAFLDAKDQFNDFYQVGAIDHYFGNGLGCDNRWGLLTTAIWGNQNGSGQFHKNGYTKKKFESIARIIGFSSVEISESFNKGTQVLIAKFKK